MECRSKENRSNIILALDLPFGRNLNREKMMSTAVEIIEDTHRYVCAVKFNHHLLLPLGLFGGTQELIKLAVNFGLITIMDCKVNDIGDTNKTIAEYYYMAGFDALIANPFIGWKEGLEPIFEVSRKQKKGVILLVYMSHKAALEGYGQNIVEKATKNTIPQYVSFAKKALEYGADGAVVGATYPEKISEIYGVLRDRVPIYSPGIGAQGGDICSAMKAGARYLIVGRAISQSESPAESARRISEQAKKCRKD